MSAAEDAALHRQIEEEALADGWDAETAKRIADNAMVGDAQEAVRDAREVRDLCRKARHPDSLAHNFIACGFNASKAAFSILDAGQDRQALQVHMMGLRMNSKWKNRQ